MLMLPAVNIIITHPGSIKPTAALNSNTHTPR